MNPETTPAVNNRQFHIVAASEKAVAPQQVSFGTAVKMVASMFKTAEASVRSKLSSFMKGKKEIADNDLYEALNPEHDEKGFKLPAFRKALRASREEAMKIAKEQAKGLKKLAKVEKAKATKKAPKSIKKPSKATKRAVATLVSVGDLDGTDRE